MKLLRIIHVDNQVESLAQFRKISSAIKSIELTGSFLNAGDALEFVNHNPVDLAFTELALPTPGNGLWLAGQLQDKNLGTVFLSDSATHASTAFEACALDFMVKPLSSESLEQTILRIRQRMQTLTRLQKQQGPELYNNYLDEAFCPKRLFINMHGQIIVINLKDVTYMRSISNYTTIKMIDGEKYTASKHLKVYGEALNTNPDFLRIHRSAIINKNFVKAILKKKHTASLVMADDEVLEVSAKKKDLVLQELRK